MKVTAPSLATATLFVPLMEEPPASSLIVSQVRVFISSKMYKYGFFSANIKLPGEYTAGLCVAFYTSNGDVFEKTHDELDFEFLGNTEGKAMEVPNKPFHRYSILWTAKNIIFYIDDVPIREVIRNEEMGSEYPSKPMSLYATIWDASSWATSGGKYKVNYKYAPFVSEFKDFALEGCPSDPIEEFPSVDCYESYSRLETADYGTITRRQRSAMHKFRQRFMYYSYCYDSLRYPVPPPECVVIPSERDRFRDTGRLKFGGSHQGRKRRSRRRGRVQVSSTVEYDPDV
ncbi:hypothetical protein OIU84_022498 [Salix udensis]|uniref:Xyloglucan endotransglucosylase/hydrolase n=1 Tax=Salix udensis TaxID=889485 RepID=A0AAD6KQ53_9ROSI|nr:hypothetical protein OIU84_022498 [Salix udensis]